MSALKCIYIGILIGIFVNLVIWMTYFLPPIRSINDIDDQTKQACREYADNNPESSIPRERWEWGKNKWENFDYYTSCLQEKVGK